jgi:hypothetical protein
MAGKFFLVGNNSYNPNIKKALAVQAPPVKITLF